MTRIIRHRRSNFLIIFIEKESFRLQDGDALWSVSVFFYKEVWTAKKAACRKTWRKGREMKPELETRQMAV